MFKEDKISNEDKSAPIADFWRDDWNEKLNTDDHEIAASALAEVTALRKFRAVGRQSGFRAFYDLFEQISGNENVRAEVIERAALGMSSQSPRVNDLFRALLAELDGAAYEPQFDMTANKIAELRKDSIIDILSNPEVSLVDKADIFDKRINGSLRGMEALDRRDGFVKDKAEQEERSEKLANEPTTPPPARDESKPSMDEMSRLKEGERAPALWTITPARGGYFKEQSFDTWDEANKKWVQSAYEYLEVKLIGLEDGEKISIKTNLRSNQWTRLPLPYTYELATVIAAADYEIKKDQNGDYLVLFKGESGKLIEAEFVLAKLEQARAGRNAPREKLKFQSELTAETEEKLAEIKNRKQGNLARARAISAYVKRRIKYSNNSALNNVYDTYSKGYLAAIDEICEADCDVANTYFAGLCARLDIPCRHCVGHMVKGRDADGNSAITSGTGHAWSEIWDELKNSWERIDATSAGDPQLNEDEKSEGEGVPGDYGVEEALGHTDEELAALEKKLSELTEKLSYTAEERELAEAAGVEMKEAREIVKEIAKAEDTRLKNGERVVDVLSLLFHQIIQSRKIKIPDYTGPVTKSEGGEELDEIVTQYIGIKSGINDPASRLKPDEKKQEQKIFGGFDIYMLGDKSGSMSQTVDGEAKWRTQRLAEYLIFSALHRFDANLKRAGIAKENELSVRSQGNSFRDSKVIDIDKPLSNKFVAVDKVKMWRSMGNQGSGNGDTAGLIMFRDQIQAEIAETEKSGKKDNRLRLIVACSDGYPDDEVAVRQLAEELGRMNAMVVGIGMTETARAVKKIFTTKWSRGDYAADINDLPAIVAKHLVLEAVKLFPEQSQQNVRKVIDNVLKKFK